MIRSRTRRPVYKAVASLMILGAAFACASHDGAGTSNLRDGGTIANGDAMTTYAPKRSDNGSATTDGGPTQPPDGGTSQVLQLSTLHFVGRFDTRDAAGPRFEWPGSQVRARFSGTGATLHMRDARGTNRFRVSVDGAAPVVITMSGGDRYPLATGLPDGKHDVVITKITESFVGSAQLFDITSTEGRPLVPTPPPFARNIEFIGDSITCGYGDDDHGPHGADGQCSFSPATEDESLTYATRAAAALDAGHTAIAWSGIGVYRSYDGSTTDQMPILWRRALADDATSAWDFRVIPDVVVINLGTNDFAHGDPGAPFVTAYVGFLADIRSKYPAARIIATLSPMITDITIRTPAAQAIHNAVETRNDAGDANVTYFEFDPQLASDGYGCDFHPSVTTHQKMSKKLVPVIKALTGW